MTPTLCTLSFSFSPLGEGLQSQSVEQKTGWKIALFQEPASHSNIAQMIVFIVFYFINLFDLFYSIFRVSS